MVEDYLNIISNLVSISEIVDEKSDIIKGVTSVEPADSPYYATLADEDIFCDTDGGDIDVYLPSVSGDGLDTGQNYRIVNVGSSENVVNMYPAFGDDLFGDTTELLYDQEHVIITYDKDYGWN